MAEAEHSRVEPERFSPETDGSIAVEVHQVVHDAETGKPLDDSRVRHRYQLAGGLIARMDVTALEDGDKQEL